MVTLDSKVENFKKTQYSHPNHKCTLHVVEACIALLSHSVYDVISIIYFQIITRDFYMLEQQACE